MTEICEAITLKVVVPPPIILTVDFKGEFLSSSDGEDYKRGYEEGHARGLIDGRADGYQSGYDEGHKVGSESGYSQGKQDGLTEGYDNGYTQGKADGYKDGYDEGYSKGYEQGKAENNADLLKYATFQNGNIFRNSVFPDELRENIYFKIQGTSPTSSFVISFSYAFMASNVKNITIEIIGSIEKGVTFNSVFQTCTDLISVTFANDIFYIGNGASTFNGATKLERINGVMDLSLAGNIGGMFQKCNSLKEVRFAQGSIKKSLSFSDSPNLSNESIDSLVNGYADMTGQEAPVLTVHPTVKAKIVADDEKEDTDPTKRFWLRTLTSKNVTLA